MAMAAPAQTISVLHHFGTNEMGVYPQSPLVRGADGTLYGMTAAGGALGQGQVFKFDPGGAGYTALKNFSHIDGAGASSVLLLSGQTLYGTTERGGLFDQGTIFQVKTDGSGFDVLHHFSALNESDSGTFTNLDGAKPFAGLALAGGFLFGTAPEGGINGSGTIFRLNPDGSDYTVLHAFSDFSSGTNAEGAVPYADLLFEAGYLYGTASIGGTHGVGTIFRLQPDGSDWTVLHHFPALEAAPAGWTNSDGAWPSAGLVASGGVLYGNCHEGGPFAYGTVYKLNPDGTGFSVLKSFDLLSEPAGPDGLLVAVGDTLFGVMASPDSFSGGVYRLHRDGSGFAVIKSFSNWLYGAAPSRGLALVGSKLYGTTPDGGTFNYGTLFELSVDGSNFRVLTNFSGGDGTVPQGGLAIAEDVFYG
ncbi:MAG TPA: choice-of-anchor tandem repeat GloVer-containing protein, partial [Gemmatimonadales bacterium]|nr:choice-of-anchor tandem repeat GloVer-containing protein [Gemmatimonadales bacterium]